VTGLAHAWASSGLGRHVRVTVTDLPRVPLARAGLAEVAVLGHR
jgi:hypothetical protein